MSRSRNRHIWFDYIITRGATSNYSDLIRWSITFEGKGRERERERDGIELFVSRNNMVSIAVRSCSLIFTMRICMASLHGILPELLKREYYAEIWCRVTFHEYPLQGKVGEKFFQKKVIYWFR